MGLCPLGWYVTEKYYIYTDSYGNQVLVMICCTNKTALNTNISIQGWHTREKERQSERERDKKCEESSMDN